MWILWCEEKQIAPKKYSSLSHEICVYVFTAGQPSATAAAFPVNYYVIPTETQGMLPISLDLVPALHFTTWPEKLRGFLSKLPQEKREDVEKVGFHAVPKQCLDGEYNDNIRSFFL